MCAVLGLPAPWPFSYREMNMGGLRLDETKGANGLTEWMMLFRTRDFSRSDERPPKFSSQEKGGLTLADLAELDEFVAASRAMEFLKHINRAESIWRSYSSVEVHVDNAQRRELSATGGLATRTDRH